MGVLEGGFEWESQGLQTAVAQPSGQAQIIVPQK
jgi:hypothetical protein